MTVTEPARPGGPPPGDASSEALRTHVAGLLERSRGRTRGLTDAVDEVDLVTQHSALMSPLVWDLAHVGSQEELWLVRGEHRLVVLLRVLDDHPEGEAVVVETPAVQRGGVQRVERLLADLRDVRACLRGREQRQLDPPGPRVPEGVVEPVDLRAQWLPAADVAHQPQLLLAAHVREVPHER